MGRDDDTCVDDRPASAPGGPGGSGPDDDLILGRYRLIKLLGIGGFGEVFLAEDQVLRREVALKRLPAMDERALGYARAEVTALRRARLPGVVRLLDDGLWRGRFILVMEHVSGPQFPGEPTPMPWVRLRPMVIRLLEILAGVHQAGLVHRDLKPGNVRLTPEGEPVLLDFGLAQPPTAEGTGLEGTPGYASPEVWFGKSGGEPRSDLYSLGVMIYQALRGEKPSYMGWDDAGLPEEAVDFLGEMLAREPAHRAESAVAVLAELDRAVAIDGLPPEPIDEVTMQSLFAGPEHFVHFCSRGAALLWARTGGRRVAEELTSWQRAGLAVFGEKGVEVTIRSLDRIEDGMRLGTRDADAEVGLSKDARHLLHWMRLSWPSIGPPVQRASGLSEAGHAATIEELIDAELAWPFGIGWAARPVVDGTPDWGPEERRAARLKLAAELEADDPQRWLNLAAGGGSADEILRAAGGLIEAELSRGAYAQARRMIELALEVGASTKAEPEWLGWAAKTAIYQQSEQSYDWALYLLGRAQLRDGFVEQLEFLIRAARAEKAGQAERADELLGMCRPFEDDALEIGRQSVALGIVQQRADGVEESAFLAGLETWANSTSRRARLASWQGNLLYRQERFREAAKQHLMAAKSRVTRTGRLRALLGAAVALLEASRFAETIRVAKTASEVAKDLRLPYEAVWACVLERAGEYRAADDYLPPPANALVLAAEGLDPTMHGLLSLYEGSRAWRLGASSTEALVNSAISSFRQASLDDHLILAESLLVSARQEKPEPALLKRARAISRPAIMVQALGLLGQHDEAKHIAACRPEESWSLRLEVTSIREAIGDSR